MLVSQSKMHNTLQTIKAKKSKELAGSQALRLSVSVDRFQNTCTNCTFTLIKFLDCVLRAPKLDNNSFLRSPL